MTTAHRYPPRWEETRAAGSRHALAPFRALDGTVNFLHGLPHVSVSVAVEDDGGGLAGVVRDVFRNEEFTASRGGGAELDGMPMRVTGRDDLAKALIATGFSYDRYHRGRENGNNGAPWMITGKATRVTRTTTPARSSLPDWRREEGVSVVRRLPRGCWRPERRPPRQQRCSHQQEPSTSVRSRTEPYASGGLDSLGHPRTVTLSSGFVCLKWALGQAFWGTPSISTLPRVEH